MPKGCEPVSALPCWLEVDLDAVQANAAALCAWLGPRTRLAAVVKAQAYGTGAEEVARAAIDGGASWLAVARVHEAVELRAAGLAAPILTLAQTHPSEALEAVRLDLATTVDRADLARALSAAARRLGRRARVHLKVDTGLHRFGLAPECLAPLAAELAQMEAVDLEGIYTHFANADEPDPSYTYEQIVHFRALLRALGSAGHAFGVRHAANSAATLDFTESHLDLVRVGIGLFGGGPPCTVASAPDLQQAVALRARVARLVELEKGEGVGYGHTWRAEVPSCIAVVSAGYADGVSRQLSNRGCALINGCETPIVGRVSMDFTTLDVTAVPGVGTDSVVTFFGTSSGRTLRLARFAGDAGTIAHDALSSVGGRVPRVYLRHGGITRILRLSGSTTL